MQVDQQFIDTLELKLSKPRLDAYRIYFSCNNDAEAIGAYHWNKAVATAFFPLIQAVEITLRNSIHDAAKAKFSGNSEWFRMRRFPKAKAITDSCYKKRDRTLIVPPPTADKVVSQLTFGFWVNMLTNDYDDPVKNDKLWPSLIPIAFPNASGSKATRKYIHRRFNFIKDFRNRIGHYEPLWKIKDTIDGGGRIVQKGPTTPYESIVRLQEYIDLILEALRWMSIERYDFLINLGIEEHVREVCSLNALRHYQGIENKPLKINKLSNQLLNNIKNKKIISGFYELRTSKKGCARGERIFLEIKHLRPPKYSV
ncbi:TPA: hypothetical protein ACX6SQ_003793 [Photobacterium damselae]|uniref:hypothetical protein n=1 Tax=Photobacterium damselae TaxID=38293 RepID=UPI004067D1D2